MTRQEKLFNIRAQVQKAMNAVDHGDGAGSDMALGDAVIAIVAFLETEMPAPEVIPKPEPEPEPEPELIPPEPEPEPARISRIKVPKK